MTTVSALCQQYDEQRPVGNLLDPGVVLAQALAAVRFYAGWAEIVSRIPATPDATPPALDQNTELSDSEWAMIRPLFLLYVEREQTMYLEASRGMGIDPFCRSSSEVAGDITQYEADLPMRAFIQPIITV